LLFALFAVRRFAAGTIAGERRDPVSVLKPWPARPGLYANLRSFWRGLAAVQLVCGIASGSDPAAAVVRRLQATCGARHRAGGRRGRHAQPQVAT